jgi:hypothetical protein
MDAKEQLMVVGTAERKIVIFNLQNPGQIYKVGFGHYGFPWLKLFTVHALVCRQRIRR